MSVGYSREFNDQARPGYSPEAAEAGTVRLVGTNTDNIVRNADRLLSNQAAHRTMSEIKNPYGDGTASKIIVKELARRLTALMPA